MTKNKMVQSGTRSHQEEKKELAGNEKRMIVESYNRLTTFWQLTHVK
jgi:hypothetical protein